MTYEQTTGAFRRDDGSLIAVGYSGARPQGVNNPAMQAVHNVGPIPQGLYSIGPPFQAVVQGPCTMRLTPVGHDALGRTDFLIHGNNADNNASTGCIVLPPEAREQIAASADKTLLVGV